MKTYKDCRKCIINFIPRLFKWLLEKILSPFKWLLEKILFPVLKWIKGKVSQYPELYFVSILLIIIFSIFSVEYIKILSPSRQSVEKYFLDTFGDLYADLNIVPLYIKTKLLIWLKLRTLLYSCNIMITCISVICTLFTIYIVSISYSNEKGVRNLVVIMSMVGAILWIIQNANNLSYMSSTYQHAWRELESCISINLYKATYEDKNSEDKSEYTKDIINKAIRLEKEIEMKGF